MAEVKSFFDVDTSTLTHIVYDQASRDAVIIDPVMNFDLQTFKTAQKSVEQLVHFCQDLKLHVRFVLETHAHADHVSGSQILKEFFPKSKICIGQEITKVQSYFAEFFDLGPSFPCDGSQFDSLYSDGMELDAGSFSVKTLHTPGHTAACYTLQIGNHLFTGDALFAPDLGTGRCDLPGGDSRTLYKSVKNVIYAQPDSSILYFGHDYPERRELMENIGLSEQKKKNSRLNMKTTEDDFVKYRAQRDKELSPPRLLLPSLLINIAAGKLPAKRKNGKVYLSIPLNSLNQS